MEEDCVLKILKQKGKAVEERLAELLDVRGPLFEAMYYSVSAGGKRLRPTLLLASFEMFYDGADSGVYAVALDFACALEMIHTYSLIHDDLPALDNDGIRRGKPTSHVRFGEAMAILAGDGLLNMAYEIMSSHCAKASGNGPARAMSVIAGCAGVNGMIEGQVTDILSENNKVDFDTLIYMHKRKTAALFKAALCAGAIIAGASESDVVELGASAEDFGIAFQIKDDILDMCGDAAVLGKETRHDAALQKATYVSVCTLENAVADLNDYSEKAIARLDNLNRDAAFLKGLYKMLINREK